MEEAELEEPLSLSEVSEVVKQLLSVCVCGEIHLEMLKALDIVGQSWRSGTVPMDWQTRMVVPIFKKGDRRLQLSGTKLLSLQEKLVLLLERVRLIVEPDSGGAMSIPSWPWNSGPALHPAGLLEGS